MYSPALSAFPTSINHTSPRRARLKEHFVQVAAEVLTGYDNLSDGARLTYLVLLSFDYLDVEHGDHKGIVFPSIETLMAKRNKSRSTIYSHLTELEQFGLIEPIPGIGWRLYNPPERPQDSQPTIDPSVTTAAATDEYSPSETNVQTSLPSADMPARRESPATPKFQKSGHRIKENKEQEEINNKHNQLSKAGEGGDVVGKLIEVGFNRLLARQFLNRYGGARVQRQLANLAHEQARGTTIRSVPRWLYQAITLDYQVTMGEGSGTPAQPKQRYREEFFTDEHGELRICLTEITEDTPPLAG